MGREISTDSTLFFSEVDAFSPKETISVEKKPEKLVEFDTIKKDPVADSKPSSFGESLTHEVIKESPQTTDSLLNFDLASTEDNAVNEQKNNGSIDFVLSTPAPKIETSSDALGDVVFKTPELEIKNKFESLEFESNETKALKTDEIDNAAAKGTAENTVFIDKQTDESSGLNNIFSNDSLDSDFFLDKPVLGLQEKGIDRTLDVFDLTDRDEMETKLDLIKAYIDMNDAETAKKLACEVLEKGSTEQQKVAQALVDELK